MSKFKIREMTFDDIDEILQIEEMCYGAHHWSRESFVTELGNEISTYRCVVDENNKVYSSSKEGALLTKDGKELIKFQSNSILISITNFYRYIYRHWN